MSSQRTPIAFVWFVYTAFRLLLFVVPFLVIWGLSDNPVLAAVVAAVIGFALSIILLDLQRAALARALGDRMESRRPTTDESVEDGTIDAQTDSIAARPKP